MMTSNSKFKEVLGEGEWLSPRMITAVAALGAAAVRARIYAPLLEGGSSAPATVAEKQPLKIAWMLLKEEGVLGFFKGSGVNLLRYAPHAVLSFTFIDLYKQGARSVWL